MNIFFPLDKGVVFDRFWYPAGEQQVRIKQEFLASLSSQETIKIVAKLRTAEDMMGLLLLGDALGDMKGGEVHLILPYLPYSRADRRFVDGDCWGLLVFLRLLGCSFDQIITLDAHSDVAKNVRHSLINVPALSLVELTKDKLIREGFVNPAVLLPDKGAARYGMNCPTCEKKRDPQSGKLSGFIVPDLKAFEGSDCILIVDDICDAGGTFIGIAEELTRQGNELPLYLYVTHGLFSRGTGDLLKHFKHIYTSDSFEDDYHGVTRFPAASLLLSATPLGDPK